MRYPALEETGDKGSEPTSPDYDSELPYHRQGGETTRVRSDHEERTQNHSIFTGTLHHTPARYPPDPCRHSLSIIASHPSRSHVSATAQMKPQRNSKSHNTPIPPASLNPIRQRGTKAVDEGWRCQGGWAVLESLETLEIVSVAKAQTRRPV